MAGLDTLLVKPMEEEIRENLGEKTLQKIEKRLFERHGMNLTQSIQKFQVLDNVLREFFGDGAEGLERQVFEKVMMIEKLQAEERSWTTIENSSLARTILETLSHEDNNMIINAVLSAPKTITEISDECKISSTVLCAKVNSLVEHGILISSNGSTQDGIIENKYSSIFEGVNIVIKENSVKIKVKINAASLKTSSLVQVCMV
ncbi:MAG: transcriptional regulator [Thaumarchaeota archaeon]|nr:transcriptional regulator [Nitrososphaerota archaeon]